MANCVNNPRPVMSTIHTEVDLIHPTADMINPLDVAMSLTRKGRFNDLSNRPFSVAKHLMLCDALAQEHDEVKTDEDYLYILLHDAHEAYLGDLVRPMKALLGERAPGLVEGMEMAMDVAIFERFGCPQPRAELVAARVEIDNLSLAAEKEVVFPSIGDRWTGLPTANADILSATIELCGWSQPDTFDILLRRWADLSPTLQLEMQEAQGNA